MANLKSLILLFLSIITLLLIYFPNCAVSISAGEYHAMEIAIRNRGYHLFCNSMDTSDLQFQLSHFPPNISFTIFVPTDTSLFAYDMTQTASAYVDTLRFHIVPHHRLSLVNLRTLPSTFSFSTLLPSHYLHITANRPSISVSGVLVVSPGLFYNQYIAVHGLAGIFNVRSGVSSSRNLRPGARPLLPGETNTTMALAPTLESTDHDLDSASVHSKDNSTGNSSALSPSSSPSLSPSQRNGVLPERFPTLPPEIESIRGDYPDIVLSKKARRSVMENIVRTGVQESKDELMMKVQSGPSGKTNHADRMMNVVNIKDYVRKHENSPNLFRRYAKSDL